MVSQFYRIITTALVVMSFCSVASAANNARINVGLVITGAKKLEANGNNTRAKFTCNAARTKISLSGYKNVKTLRCQGNVYEFSAQTNSSSINIGFDALTGEITHI